ncbi:MAG: selenide, water dikinase SelD [Deltaproteobacteria bacterium RBG_16_48_10]|nr:MAG: selenide, water dikinase SelD [Deltaproteobacteria bacterium RBG_16_48_10]
MGPEDLDQVLKGLSLPKDPRVLVGIETSDDAGVYLLNDEIALVQTADFFTPIVDDPFVFGQIAVVNALSDVYAMGGRPLTALNLVGFPIKTLSPSILREILRGGLSKMEEAGVALVGGHTVEDPEVKYGLAVTGIVHPHKILSNAKAIPGDQLVLTKPLGTGVISTALKGEMASEEAVQKMVASMITLNRKACEWMQVLGAHACTDITGFGFIGHALEMASASQVGLVIQSKSIPFLPKALEYGGMGLIPGGAYSNRQFFSCKVEVGPTVPSLLIDLLYDPQTSGGLLVSLPPGEAEKMVTALHREGHTDTAIVGEVFGEPRGRMKIL